MKANNHPLVRDLRRMLDKHGLEAAILIAITKERWPVAASAGTTVEKCNAIGTILESDHVDILKFDMDEALTNLEAI